MLSEPSRRHCTRMDLTPEEAKTITRKYFESLGLAYQISYGNPEMGDVSLIDSEEFGSNTVSVDYKILVYLKDKDGTEITCSLFVNSESRKFRENPSCYPTKEDLESLMEETREHYQL